MNMKKAIAATVCAGMVVVGSVAGTMAYFTDTTDTLNNVMTVGNVNIGLYENGVTTNENGALVKDTSVVKDASVVVEGADRIGNDYKLMPGSTYPKNPTVKVEAGSEACYVFIEVNNAIADIEDESNTIASQITGGTTAWTALGENYPGIYWRLEDANTSTSARELPVFENFTIDEAQTDLSAYNNTSITIKAYAIQKDNIANAAAAWTALHSN